MDGASYSSRHNDQASDAHIVQRGVLNQPRPIDALRRQEKLARKTFRFLLCVCIITVLTFILILSICLVLRARGKLPGDDESDPVVVSSPRHVIQLRALSAYDLSHLDDTVDPFANASGWFVLPTSIGIWMQEVRNPIAVPSEPSEVTNAHDQIIKCANHLLRLDSKDDMTDEPNATYMALLECKQVIENRLADLTGDHRQYWPPLYTRYSEVRPSKRAANRQEQDWEDQVNECVTTYCEGFNGTSGNCDMPDSLAGLRGPWQNCHLCFPKSDDQSREFQAKIQDHCKKMVGHQWKAFYMLCGLLLMSISVAATGILIKNRRARHKTHEHQSRKKAWVISRMKARSGSNNPNALPSTVSGRAQEDGSTDLEGGEKINGFHSRWYTTFGKRTAGREQGDSINLTSLPPNLQGSSTVNNLVPVMPLALNAKGRSSSFVRVESSTGLRSRGPSGNASDTQRQHASSDPGRIKNGSLDDSMPVTNKVFKYGLEGRLCGSDPTNQSNEG